MDGNPDGEREAPGPAAGQALAKRQVTAARALHGGHPGLHGHGKSQTGSGNCSREPTPLLTFSTRVAEPKSHPGRRDRAPLGRTAAWVTCGRWRVRAHQKPA